MKFEVLASLVEVLTRRFVAVEKWMAQQPTAEVLAETVLARIPVPKDGVSPDADELVETVLARIPTPKDGVSPDADELVETVLARVVLPEPKEPSVDAIASALVKVVPQMKDGEPGEPGEPGERGPIGPMPDHKWIGTKLQFEKPDGDWGAAVDLKGDKGDPGKGGSGGVIVRDSDGGGGIDDATVGTDTTWSSEKIAAELATVAPPEEGGVASVNGRGGAVVLTASDVGLPNVVNLAPADLPISDATQAALDAKTTPAYVDAKVAALVNSSPSALDTLKELADALGDDPNFATTMTTALGGKEASITAGTTAQYWRGDKTWRDIFTDVRAATLTGLSTATNAVISATDTVLSALGKLQKQVTDLGTTKASLAGDTFTGQVNITPSAASATLQLKNASASYGNYLTGARGANAQWQVALGTATSAANFDVYRYSDAGAYVATPLSIDRATGRTTLESLTVTGALSNAGLTSALALKADASSAAIRDGITYVGLASNNINLPYMQRLSDSSNIYLVHNVNGYASGSVWGLYRGSGYITFQTDIGEVACAYSPSDERLKRDIKPSMVSARDLIDRVEFISHRFKRDAMGMDSTVEHQVAFRAQQLRSLDSTMVIELPGEEGRLQLNEASILAYVAKTTQELSAALRDAMERIAVLESLTQAGEQ